MRNRALPTLIPAILCLALTAGPAQADPPDIGQLQISHRQEKIFNKLPHPVWTETDLVAKVESISILSSQAAQIVIIDPNFLLFDYNFDEVVQSDTENLRNAQQFAAVLGELGTALGEAGADLAASGSGPALAAGPRAGGAAEVLSSPNIADLRADIAANVRISEGLSRRIQALGSAATEVCRQEWCSAAEGLKSMAPGTFNLEKRKMLEAVLDGVEEVNKIQEILQTYNLDSGFFTDLGNLVRTVAEQVEMFPSLTKKSVQSAAAMKEIDDAIKANWNISENRRKILAALEKIDKAEFKLLTVIGERTPAEVHDQGPALVAILLAKDQESKVKESLRAVQTFADRVAKSVVAWEIGGRLHYEAGKISTVKFTITPVAANAEIAAETKLPTGTFEISIEPRSRVLVGFGAAVVYSFVEKPDFGTKTDGGTTTIIRKDAGNEYVAQEVGAMLTLTPRAWADPEFGAGFFVGIVPDKDEIGFFAGAGFRLFRLVQLGAGYTYQQVPTLADGLKVGQAIAKPEDLKTDTKFKGGWFLSMGIKFR